jgi:glucans biosynthesis protein
MATGTTEPGHPTGPIVDTPRCGARTRTGGACRSSVVKGRHRCRMHGGAKGSGAPFGNRNACKQSAHAREAVRAKDQQNDSRSLPTEPNTRGHARNTGPMLAARRCGARTRSGGACRCPAASGKTRCRMHGGGKGSGAPVGNHNARKHGTYTREAARERAEIRALCREAQQLLGKGSRKKGDV